MMSGINYRLGCPYLTWRKHRFIGIKDNYVGDICVGSKKKISIILEKRQSAAAVILKHYVIVRSISSDSDPPEEDYDFKNVPFLPTTRLLRNNVFFTPPGGVLTLENAPDRILKLIFSFIGDAKTLSTCELVCKKFRDFLHRVNCVKTRTTVSKMTFQAIGRISTPKCLSVKKNRKDSNGELKSKTKKEKPEFADLKWYVPWSSDDLLTSISHILKKFKVSVGLGFIDVEVTRGLLRTVTRYQPGLTEIRFLRCYVHENALEALSSVRCIKELSIDTCDGSSQNSISSDALIPVLKRNELRAFELSSVNALTAVDDRLIDVLLSTCQYNRFNYLKLGNCPKVTTGAIADMANQYMRSDKRRFIVFLENTGFDTDRFLSTHKSFVLDPSNASSRRVELRSHELRIWVETKKTR